MVVCGVAVVVEDVPVVDGFVLDVPLELPNGLLLLDEPLPNALLLPKGLLLVDIPFCCWLAPPIELTALASRFRSR